ncbi:MAG: PTS sugar transporter subunit IIC [Candidatus Adiutrix sp.]|jgi:mannose/fructose/N-acetylgalactosamine-specific phosphotransferase system component IIC|nr:PTS sugar transporter subunit IIC [Candidatus Adiutrix sp.]
MPFSPSLLAAFPGLVFLGAVLNIDRQVCGPFMLGRPLVTGLVLGLAVGRVDFGVWMGLSAELLWLAALPLGGQITPNASLAVSAAFIAWAKSGHASAPPLEAVGDPGQASLVIAFLTVPVWAKAMGLIDLVCRRLMPPILSRVRADLAGDREPHFMRRNLYGLFINLALSGAVLAAAAFINIQVVGAAVDFASRAVLLKLCFIFNLMPFVGLLGMAVFLEQRSFPFYLGGLLASLLALSSAV